MGHLLYYQFVIQDLFQIEFDQFVEEHPKSDPGISRRHAKS